MNRSLFHTTIILLVLVILGSAWSFNLAQVDADTGVATEAAAACPLNLTFGETVQCSIDLAGETDSFSFSGSAGDRIRARVVKTSGTLSPFQEIIRPGGTTLCGTVTGEMTCLLDSSGTHTLLIDDFGGSGTGNYSLYLQRLNNPVGCSPIAFGALPATGSIGEAAENDCFTFTPAAGDRVRAQVVKTAGAMSPFQEIVRPGGTTLCGTVTGNMTCLIDADGAHTILIKDFGGTSTGNYSVYLQRLNNPVGCSPIAFGALPATDSIGEAAENDCFTFTLAAGDRVRARVVKTTGAMSPFQEIVRPDGTTLCGTVTGSITCQADADGLHTILIRDFGGTSAGNYSLYLQRLNNPVGCANIAFSGVPTSGVINVAAETDCFTFNGLLDKQIRVRAVRSSGTLSPFKEVTRPDGTTLCGTIISEMTCQLDAAGSHTILIYDFGGTNSGGYELTLICLTQPCGPPLPYSVYLPLVLR